jgi:hypothetical protein
MKNNKLILKDLNMAIKKNEQRVDKLFSEYCSGIQIPIFDLSKVSDVGMKALAAGDDETIGNKMKAFAESLSKG